MDQNDIIGPVIEKPNPDAFITEHPMDIMLSGNYNKVPIIIGYNSLEGIIMELNNKLVLNKETKYRYDDFQKAIPYYYNLEKNSQFSKSIAKNIEEFYYGFVSEPEDDIEYWYTVRKI